MELLKIFLLFFVSFGELDAGVQFRHFPITDERSESHDTSKSETRIIAKPTGRPSRPSDLNPFSIINKDNVFSLEKPKVSGSLADEIKKQLSAHLKSSSGRRPVQKKKPDEVIREPVIKSFRKPIRSKTLSTRPKFNIVNQKVTTELPVVNQKVTTELPTVTSSFVSAPLVEIKSHATKIRPSTRVKIPVKKKRLVFRGRGRKIETGENIIKRVPVDITLLNKQNVLKAIQNVEPNADIHGINEPDLFLRRRKPNLERQSAVRVDKRKPENISKSEIKTSTISLPPKRRKFTLSRQSVLIGNTRRQAKISKQKVETTTIPILPSRRNPIVSRETLFSDERKQEIISKPEIKSKSVIVPLSPIRTEHTLLRQSAVPDDMRRQESFNKEKIKSGNARIHLSQNRRLPALAKLAAKIAEKRKQDRKINFAIEPRRREEIVLEENNGGNDRSKGILTERQRSSLQVKVRSQLEKRLNLTQKTQSKIRQNIFLPKLQSFFQPNKTPFKDSQFQQVKESISQKVNHIKSEQGKGAVTHHISKIDSVHSKDASFQSIHPFNVKTSIPNLKQSQEIIPKTVNKLQQQDALDLNQHNSRLLPVTPLNSQEVVRKKGGRFWLRDRESASFCAGGSFCVSTTKNVKTEAPRSSPKTVTVSSQPTTQPNIVIWTPTISNTYEQETTINDIEYTTQIPKRNIEFEETNKRQHPKAIKLDTAKILKLAEKEEDRSNEIFVYPTFELAMDYALATWDQDPYRIKSKNAGKAMFDIDYSLDPEKYEAPYIEYDPTFAITTPITTQRPVSTTPYIQRQPSIQANPNLLQSSPSERNQQLFQLQLRRQEGQQSTRVDPRLQRQEEQLVLKARQTHQKRKQVPHEQENPLFLQQELSKFSHQLLQRARQEFQKQHNKEEPTQPLSQNFQQQERQFFQKSRQQIPQNKRQQLIQQTRHQLSQKLKNIRQPIQKARQPIPKRTKLQLPQKDDQDFKQNTQHLENLRRPLTVQQVFKENNPVNNLVSGNIRFRNKARGPKSERRVITIPAFDQYDYFDEDSEIQSDEEIEALKKALTFTIDWG